MPGVDRSNASAWRNAVIGLALAAVVVLAYWPALRAPFLIDDALSLSENSSLRALWPLSIPLHPPAGGRAVSGRPLVNLSFAVDQRIISSISDSLPGPSIALHPPAVYRVHNLLLHLLCGALVFALIVRTSKTPRLARFTPDGGGALAWAVVSIWLLHPLLSETVNYIVQRTELMASAACLGTLYASIRALDAHGRRARVAWVGVAGIVCFAGMASKEVMVVTPIIVLLYDRAFLFDSWTRVFGSTNRRWLYSLFLVAEVYMLSVILGGARSDSVGFQLGVPWYEYLYGQGWAVANYLRLVFWPHPLIIDYGQDPTGGLRPVPGILLLAAVGAGTIWAWLRIETWGWAAFLGSTFFLLLAPSSSVVPIRTEFAAERRVYLASACILIVLVAGTLQWLRSIRTAVRPYRRLGLLCVVSTCAVLGFLTFRRSTEYAHPESLWRPVIAQWPRNARAYSNLGMAIAADSTRLAEAEPLFRRAVGLDSTLAPAWLNLAYVAVAEHRTRDAEEPLQRALALKQGPTYADAVQRYGRLLVELGESSRATPYLERAVSLNRSEDNLFWLGVGYFNAGQTPAAADAFRNVLLRNPDRTDAMRSLGEALIESGHSHEAIDYLKASVVRDPLSSVGWALTSVAEANIGDTLAALDAARASARVGDSPRAHVLAGTAMLRLHSLANARWHFSQAVRLQPANWQAHAGLGRALVAAGEIELGKESLRHALDLRPDDALVRKELEGLVNSVRH